MKTALLCASAGRLEERLNASLSQAGYTVESVPTQQEAISALKEGARDALVSEVRRDAFAFLVQSAFRLHPAMPIHLIEGGSVFCFYPASQQPGDLIDAITGAGVKLPSSLMRHTRRLDAVAPEPDAFMV
jgi:hypothetical protein